MTTAVHNALTQPKGTVTKRHSSFTHPWPYSFPPTSCCCLKPGHAVTPLLQPSLLITPCIGSSPTLAPCRPTIVPPSTCVAIVHPQVGVPSLVCFLNKVDKVEDPELVDLVELEIRELLSFHGFSGDDIAMVRGSALCALKGEQDDIGKNAVLELMATVDKQIPEPPRLLD